VGGKYKIQLLAPKTTTPVLWKNSKEEKLHQVRVALNKMHLCQFCILSRTEGFLWTLRVFKPPEPLLNFTGSAKPVQAHATFFFLFSWTYKPLWFPRTIQHKRKKDVKFNVKGKQLANGRASLNWDGRTNKKKKKAGRSLLPMYTWDLY